MKIDRIPRMILLVITAALVLLPAAVIHVRGASGEDDGCLWDESQGDRVACAKPQVHAKAQIRCLFAEQKRELREGIREAKHELESSRNEFRREVRQAARELRHELRSLGLELKAEIRSFLNELRGALSELRTSVD